MDRGKQFGINGANGKCKWQTGSQKKSRLPLFQQQIFVFEDSYQLPGLSQCRKAY